MAAEGVGEVVVQAVRHGAGHAFPGQDEDDQDGALAAVARAVSDQTQQLLLLAATPDHLVAHHG